MAPPTLIALVILTGTFLVIITTILKDGSDKAIKMMGSMGAIMGVAFGSIVTYFFKDSEVNEANNRAEVAEERLENVSREMEYIGSAFIGYNDDFADVYGDSVLNMGSIAVDSARLSEMLSRYDELMEEISSEISQEAIRDAEAD